MKINNVGQYGINPYQKASNKADASQKNSAATDKVEISSKAKELQGTSSVMNERQDKIEKIKMQIENGTYQLNTKETAKGMVDFYKK